MEHFIITHNVKIAIGLLYAFVFFLMGITKFFQIVMKKEVDNIWIRVKSFLFIVIFFTLAFIFNKIVAFIFLMLIS